MQQKTSSTKRRTGFSMVELQVVSGIFSLLMMLMVPSVSRSREAARRTQCRNNMKQLALGINNYENKFRIYPPAVIVGTDATIAAGCKKKTERTGGFSWRVLILPDIEEYNLYDTIDFNGTAGTFTCAGKDGKPHRNILAFTKQIEVYFCPSDSTLADVDENKYFGTNYAAMISSRPDYTYTTNVSHKTKTTVKQIGVLHPQKVARQRDVANDGTSHTIALVEASRARKLIERGKPKKSEHHRCGRWFNSQGCLADASRTPDDFGTKEKPKQDEASIDDPVVWGGFVDKKTKGWGRTASSHHGGGAHVAMVDGSVHYVTKGVNLNLYKATCTRSGLETETLEF